MTFTRIFVLEQKFAYTWGAQAVFWGGTGPEMHSSGIGPVTLFCGTIVAWGAQFSLVRGTSSGLGGEHGHEMPSVAPSLHFTCLQTP